METPALPRSDGSLVTVTHVVYALHALSLLVGAFGPASIIFGGDGNAAVIISYVKRSEARGTWLESHFTWQIRTFWYTLLWALVVAAVMIASPAGYFLLASLFAPTWIMALTLIGFVT